MQRANMKQGAHESQLCGPLLLARSRGKRKLVMTVGRAVEELVRMLNIHQFSTNVKEYKFATSSGVRAGLTYCTFGQAP